MAGFATNKRGLELPRLKLTVQALSARADSKYSEVWMDVDTTETMVIYKEKCEPRK